MKLTHPDKILYPEDKITKEMLLEYYRYIEPWILPYILDRALTLVRCPTNYEHCFYQKHIDENNMPGLKAVSIKDKKGVKDDYIYLDNKEGILAFPQLNVLEIHPWGSKIDDIECPDIIVFDLDPGPNVPWKEVVLAALEVKKQLAAFKLKSFVKTTGGKGLHVVIPIKPEYKWPDVKKFTETFVTFMATEHPEKYVKKMQKSLRNGKIFLDYLRNERGATAIAPYSPRARVHAPVATPLHWDELTNHISDTFFTIEDLPLRLDNVKNDPWKDFFILNQSLHLDDYKNK